MNLETFLDRLESELEANRVEEGFLGVPSDEAGSLEHFAIRFDAFNDIEPHEGVRVDADGHAFYTGKWDEPLEGSTLSMFIKPGTSKTEVMQMLSKLSDFVKRVYDQYTTGYNESVIKPNEIVAREDFI